MKISDFSGGLNLKIASSKLQSNEAVELVNADISSRELRSAKALSTENYAGVSQYFHQFSGDGLIRSLATKTKFVEYDAELFYINASKLTSWDGTTERVVGIPQPSPTPLVIAADNVTPLVDRTLAVEAYFVPLISEIAGGDIPAGLLQYKVEFYGIGTTLVNDIFFDYTMISDPATVTMQIQAPPSSNGALFRLYLGTYHRVSLFTVAGTVITSLLTDDIYDISANPSTTATEMTETLVLQAATEYSWSWFDSSLYNPSLPEIDSPKGSAVLTTGAAFLPNSQGKDYFMVVYQLGTVIVDSAGVDGLCRLFKGVEMSAGFGGVKVADFIEDLTLATECEHNSGLSSTYQYVYTHYDPATGAESKPSKASAEVTVSNGVIEVSVLPTPVGLEVRIYRVGGTLGEFSLAGVLPSGPSTFYDIIQDENINGLLLAAETYDIPPDNMTSLTESAGVILGAIANKLVFSIQGLVFAWPIANFIRFNKPITLIQECVNGIIVCTRDTTHIVTGTTPANYSVSLVSGEHGCISDESYQRLGNGVIFQSRTQLCFTTGGSVQLLTKNKFNPLDISILSSVVHNNTYYASSATDIFILNLTDGSFSTVEIAVNFMGVVDGVVQVTIGTSLVELFGSTLGLLPLTYLSPVVSEGVHSNRKIYKSFYVAANGTFVVEVFLDGASVVTKAISGRDAFEVNVPQISQRALDAQVKITGTGTVYEVEWKAMGRQNGK